MPHIQTFQTKFIKSLWFISFLSVFCSFLDYIQNVLFCCDFPFWLLSLPFGSLVQVLIDLTNCSEFLHLPSFCILGWILPLRIVVWKFNHPPFDLRNSESPVPFLLLMFSKHFSDVYNKAWFPPSIWNSY